MNAEMETARDDLAYMRSLVGGTERMQATIGEAFFWAGVLYGAQCGLHVLQVAGLAPEVGVGALAIAWLPTVIFCAMLAMIIAKDRKAPKGGASSRTLSAVFQGAGIANLATAFVFAYGAYKFEAPGLWLYHPVVVCMFQGVAWYVAWVILRRTWLGFVAIGWLATSVGLGVVIDDVSWYLGILSVALVVLMAIPGYVMWRGAKRA